MIQSTSNRPAFRSIMPCDRYPNARSDASVLYVGLGDQFDDDRRLVRETASAPTSAKHKLALVGK
jgi:hypothetical protein